MAKGFCDSMTDDVFDEKLGGVLDALNGKQNLLDCGNKFYANIDSVGTGSGRVDIGLSWCHSTTCSGTQPAGSGDYYYDLLTLRTGEGTLIQLAFIFSWTSRLVLRMYVNNVWDAWTIIK